MPLRPKTPRLAVRAIIVENGKLLLVNAYGAGKDGLPKSELLCAPGGGVEAGSGLPENLAREVMEETGVTIEVGAPIGVNEFHDPASGFHQVEIFFRAKITSGTLQENWQDPEAIVTTRRWASEEELKTLRTKPGMLADLAFDTPKEAQYDPLETIVD